MLILELTKIIWFYFKRSIGQWKECLSALSDTISDFLWFDRKFNVNTIGFYITKSHSQYSDPVVYQTPAHKNVKKILDYLKLGKSDIFVDIGCGKGRILILAAIKGVKKVIGVELDKTLVGIARDNVNKLKLKIPIEIFHHDAARFDFKEGTVFFMFNPFGQKTLRRVLENIRYSLHTNPRKISIVYRNPVYGSMLDACDWLVSKGELDKTGAFRWCSRY